MVNIGQPLAFTSFVSSATPVTYQWKRNGLPIPGATASAYAFANATPLKDSGWYQFVATNAGGSTTSAVMFVNVAVNAAQIVAWGDNQKGQLNVPSGLSSVAAIAVGGSHSLALKADGTVTAWGGNDFGQTNVPAGLSNVVAIAAASSGSLALRADGTVVGWGNVTVPAGLSGVVAICADLHNVALKSDGTVVAWGVNYFGSTDVPAGLNGVVAIACGNYNNLALKSDGSVVAWGSNIYGQTNVPAGLTGVTAVAVSDRGFALKSDRSVVIWGVGLYVGQTSMPAGVPSVAAISARYLGNLALMADGTVLGWGAPSVPSGLGQVVAVAMGQIHALALRDASGTTAPVISAQPASQTVTVGQPVAFSVTASLGGASAVGYQWRKDGVNILGATGASLTISQVSAAASGRYDVVISNYLWSVTSSAATLSAIAPPVITAQTRSTTIVAGVPVTLSVSASTTATPLTYQWQKDGANIAGATRATLTIDSPQASDAGTYVCVLTNPAGLVTTSAATLTVLFAARLANASMRTTLATGQSIIVGFVVSGGSKDVLVRAAGPALSQFGLSAAMADPRLELYRGAVKVVENDNWPGSLSGTFAALGAFPFAANSRDAAVLQAVSGGHSAIVSGSGPGVVLVETYDASTNNAVRLINISARNRVGVDADILIAGFSVAGSGTKTVLIRAVGPTLGAAPFNVPGVLADPKVEVYDSAGALIVENDNWESSLTATFASVGAFPFASGSKDAALIVILRAGNSYTAQVKGADGGTGEALIEIYDLP